MIGMNGSSFGRAGGFDRRYPGGTECSRIFDTVLQKTAKLMVFTLIRAASKRWRRLKGANQLPLVVDGIKFTDGIAINDAETCAA